MGDISSNYNPETEIILINMMNKSRSINVLDRLLKIHSILYFIYVLQKMLYGLRRPTLTSLTKLQNPKITCTTDYVRF